MHRLKSFGCSYCDKNFSTARGLKKHMLVHTREKAFSCICCGKFFCRSGELKSHMLVHTREKPYAVIVGSSLVMNPT